MGYAQGDMVSKCKKQSTILVRSLCCLRQGRAQTFCPAERVAKQGSARSLSQYKTDG